MQFSCVLAVQKSSLWCEILALAPQLPVLWCRSSPRRNSRGSQHREPVAEWETSPAEFNTSASLNIVLFDEGLRKHRCTISWYYVRRRLGAVNAFLFLDHGNILCAFEMCSVLIINLSVQGKTSCPVITALVWLSFWKACFSLCWCNLWVFSNTW